MIDIKYQECIQSVIGYIENNLQSNLSNAELAGIAGYSEYHFLRIFKDIVHLTPADYIRKRRITEIVRCMEKEGRPISQILLLNMGSIQKKISFVRLRQNTIFYRQSIRHGKIVSNCMKEWS